MTRFLCRSWLFQAPLLCPKSPDLLYVCERLVLQCHIQFGALILRVKQAVDVFVVLDKDNELNNYGPGKRFPGMVLHDADGVKMPVLFAASPKASMTSTILKEMLKMMDEKKITERGVDDDRNPYFPAAIVDGHVSRMGVDFLIYVCEDKNAWMCMLGAPYGTDIWQPHDDKRLNGTFKCQLSAERSKFSLKKRVHKLDPDLRVDEIVVVLKPVIERTYMNGRYAKGAIAHRGFNPFNRNPLDHPEILPSAPAEIISARTMVLRSRGTDTRSNAILPPGQRNLLETGTGRLIGDAAAASQAISQALEEVNLSGSTASNIMALTQNAAARQAGQANNNELTARPSAAELKIRYDESSRITSGNVFAADGIIGSEVRDAVIAKRDAKEKKEAVGVKKTKDKLRAIIEAIKTIRKEMKKKGKTFKWTNKKYKAMIFYKKRKGDKAVPSKAVDLKKTLP